MEVKLVKCGYDCMAIYKKKKQERKAYNVKRWVVLWPRPTPQPLNSKIKEQRTKYLGISSCNMYMVKLNYHNQHFLPITTFEQLNLDT